MIALKCPECGECQDIKLVEDKVYCPQCEKAMEWDDMLAEVYDTSEECPETKHCLLYSISCYDCRKMG